MDNLSVYKDALTVIVPIITIALGVQAWIYTRIEQARKECRESSEDADDKLGKLRENHHRLSNDLFAFREQVARENITQATLEKFENRLILSVDKLGERFDRLMVGSHQTTVIK